MDLTPNFHLLSSTRYDPALLDAAWNTYTNGGNPSPYLLLSYHLDRLLCAAEAHKWSLLITPTYAHLQSACDEAVRNASSGDDRSHTAMKVRILFDHTGHIRASATAISTSTARFVPHANSEDLSHDFDILQQNEQAILDLSLDPLPTSPSLFTRTKTTHRPEYDKARTRTGIPPLPMRTNTDVLLHNHYGELMETSIRNVAFRRGSPPRWVTPRAESGCLPGVMRRWLLEQGWIFEAEAALSKDDLTQGEHVLTFNSVEGVRCGRVAHLVN